MSEPKSRMVFVVGAPRCGTTSLSTWLKEHPDVCFAATKEPHFFSHYELPRCTGEALRAAIERDYVDRFFPDRAQKGPVLAEGSVSYLYAPERMQTVLGLWPEAKFVIAVRDPMEMLPSLHLRLLYNGDEAETDFERAWSLSPSRRRGRFVPRTCVDPRWLDYEEIARLGKHVGRFIDTVGRERCFVSVFDDLAADPEAVYRDMLDFLDLPYRPRTDFSPQRTSRTYRLGPLQRLLKRPPRFARAFLAGEKVRRRVVARPNEAMSWPVRTIMAARKRIIDWNSVETAPAAIPTHLKIRIQEEYHEDLLLLSEVIGRKLDHWLSPEWAPPEWNDAWRYKAIREAGPASHPRGDEPRRAPRGRPPADAVPARHWG